MKLLRGTIPLVHVVCCIAVAAAAPCGAIPVASPKAINRGQARVLEIGVTPVHLRNLGIWGFYPRVQANSPLARAFNAAIRQFVDSEVRGFRVQWRQNVRDVGSDNPWMLSIDGTVTSAGQDPGTADRAAGPREALSGTAASALGPVISGYLRVDEYSGEAHSNWFYHGFTFALIHGHVVRCGLARFLRSGRRARHQANRAITAAFRNTDHAPPFMKTGVDKMGVDASEANAFAISPTGIMFLFDPYTLGSFSDGSFKVVAPFGDLSMRRDAPLPRPAALLRSRVVNVGLTPVTLRKLQISGFFPLVEADTLLAKAFNAAIRRFTDDEVRGFRVMWRHSYGKPGMLFAWYMDVSGVVTDLQPGRLISGYLRVHEEPGREHGDWFYHGFTFAVVHGRIRELGLAGLIGSGRAATHRAGRSIAAVLRASKHRPEQMDPSIDPARANAVAVTPIGMLFLFDPYTLSYYGQGSFKVVVPFAKLPMRSDVPLR